MPSISPAKIPRTWRCVGATGEPAGVPASEAVVVTASLVGGGEEVEGGVEDRREVRRAVGLLPPGDGGARRAEHDGDQQAGGRVLLRVRAEPLGQGVGQRRLDPGHRGEVAREQLGVLADQLAAELPAAEGLVGIGDAGQDGVQRVDRALLGRPAAELVGHLGEDPRVEAHHGLLLAGEVVEERPRRDARGRGDLVDRHPVEAAGTDELARGVDDGAMRLELLALPEAGHDLQITQVCGSGKDRGFPRSVGRGSGRRRTARIQCTPFVTRGENPGGAR
ncbi:MAG: hypothetical protein M5U14_20680 [Acidimicrobiia bacterium]|nr:hypothetical protein [Acidimicrobiia bacterium]